MIYLASKSPEYREFLTAHVALRKKPRRDMPRALLERELAEWMLADKQAHCGEDLGAKPREISFAETMTKGAPDLAADDARPFVLCEGRARVARAYAQDEAKKCVSLWRAVIERLAYDTLRMWGCTKDEQRVAVMFFEAPSGQYAEEREAVSELADLEPDQVAAAYRAGRMKALADEAIGRERWHTRMVNAQATAAQPDLFYSLEAVR